MKDQVNNAISEFTGNAQGLGEIAVVACQCGSVCMSVMNNSMAIDFLQTNAPYIKPTFDQVMDNCNRCSNNWGIDKIDNSQMIEELQEELNELEDLDRVSVAQTGRISWLEQEIERLENEQEES